MVKKKREREKGGERCNIALEQERVEEKGKMYKNDKCNIRLSYANRRV